MLVASNTIIPHFIAYGKLKKHGHMNYPPITSLLFYDDLCGSGIVQARQYCGCDRVFYR